MKKLIVLFALAALSDLQCGEFGLTYSEKIRQEARRCQNSIPAAQVLLNQPYDRVITYEDLARDIKSCGCVSTPDHWVYSREHADLVMQLYVKVIKNDTDIQRKTRARKSLLFYYNFLEKEVQAEKARGEFKNGHEIMQPYADILEEVCDFNSNQSE